MSYCNWNFVLKEFLSYCNWNFVLEEFLSYCSWNLVFGKNFCLIVTGILSSERIFFLL